MENSNHFDEEGKENMDNFFEDSPSDLTFLPKVQNGTFFTNTEYNFENGITSPTSGDVAPYLFPSLTDAVENEYSDIFYIVNPTNGQLEEAGPSGLQIERLETIDEVTEAGPSKKAKKDMSAFEETFFKEFKAEIRKEKKLLQEEHEMRMKLWGLEMENSQQEHTLKMEILKEKLEMVRQEKETLQRERTAKYLGKFRSGPI
ncbi:uncharacterized protein LOC117172746 isoform X1 [Belonocnema kinseyi]|uniref:uncharacterized protein LOC117172746 isoform X1 n=1 Tax=Belonocnema kinseyi TaxID=2817044 RepID=UPI00143D0231|nr:uncharacterized protein LOC117172746 isoform X1 [Belonocnema kinseyi]